MFRQRRNKITALFFLLIFSVELFFPATAHALTSGPAQPEMAKFEPAGANDLVDLFTGDLKYNIPLLDVGGYPVNLSYNSGTGMEDEASWMGTGWTLNPGAVNRNMRGLPDDFDGAPVNFLAESVGDKIVKEFSKKEFKKVGATLIVKPSLFGWESGKASLNVNIYKDNYYGMGAAIGAGVDFSMSTNTKTNFTAGFGLDVNSDVRNGVDVSPNLSLSITHDITEDVTGTTTLSGGFSYNTRGGLKSTSLGLSYSTSNYDNGSLFDLSYTKYFGQPYPPVITANTANTGFTINVDGGLSLFGGYVGVGGTGSFYKEKILEPSVSVPAYGYMNYLKGRKNPDALLDFNREKDGVFLPTSPAIAMPVATQDFFTATSQAGSQQFRPYFNGNYVIFDKLYSNKSTNTSFGATIGAGNIFKGGARVSKTTGGSETRKWVDNNQYLDKAEATFNSPFHTLLEEAVAFRQVGEYTRSDINDDNYHKKFLNSIGSYDAKKVRIASGPFAYASLVGRDGSSTTINDPVKKTKRDNRATTFSYLTAIQASLAGLDKTINGSGRFDAGNGPRKAHHMSEITVTDNEGKRMVYGIPVYNLHQEDVTFSVNKPTAAADYKQARKTGLIAYGGTDATNQNKKGRDWLYSKQITPGYATSFLLTGILSPDYVDKTGNGITDDDLGTAVKFNYEKLGSNFKWRAPFDANKANYNEGFLSDPKDDKATYVYGEKETWYLKSIESKTIIAIFKTSSREDGLGVLGNTGGRNDNVKLKKLDQILLYSKADWIRYLDNPGTYIPVPIKTVHFEYDYSLYPGVPNNSGLSIDKNGVPVEETNISNVNKLKGKLTLKKVYFTFGNNSRGKTNPYEFFYNLENIDDGSLPLNTDPKEKDDLYTERQSDRWGTYKQSFYNRIVAGQPVLNNSEFPYTIQENENTTYSERQMTNRLVSKWQLYEIITPSGSKITAEYESDDYAFVQNKRAMQMCFVKAARLGSSPSAITKADHLVVELPYPVATVDEFKRLYLKQPDGSLLSNIFYKMHMDIDGKGKYEFVHGYAEIDVEGSFNWINDKTVSVPVKLIEGYNPVTKAAWQMLRTDLPQYAYDNYDNSDVGDGKAAILALITAFTNLGRELFQPFERKAMNRHYGEYIDFDKSMVRLCSPGYKDTEGNVVANTKLGGGARVKKITISDEWEGMVDQNGAHSAQYGQVYDYTTKDNAGGTISSGVAAYEPQIGNEENPFHEPENFTEKVHWSKDRYHYVEKPYCETYFPGASVGYSKVTVTSFGDDYANGGALVKHTGHIINEFYTAKDFPTIVEVLTLDKVPYETNLILKLFASKYIRRMVTSQGFKVELNDMHGKPSAVRVFNKAGDEISSSEYFYNVVDQDAGQKQLSNEVDVLEKDGTIKENVTLATEAEVASDVRQSKNESIGTNVGAYVGGACYLFVCVPYGGVNYSESISKESYHSVSTVKVIHRYGILKKTRTKQNGSSIEAENLLWDGETGQVVLTQTQNEFGKHTYAFTYPAYMAYDGMGAAYRNLGATFLISAPNGIIPTAAATYFSPGDEVIGLAFPKKAWVIKSSDGSLRFVDEKGNFSTMFAPLKIVRSGRRNMLTAVTGSVVCMNDPRVNGRIELSLDKKILDSKAATFKDDWAVPVNNYYTEVPGMQGTWVCKGQYWNAFSKTLFKINPATGRYYLLSYKNDNVTLGDIIREGVASGYFPSGSTPLTDFFYTCSGSGTVPDVDQIIYYLQNERTDVNGDHYTNFNDLAFVETINGGIKLNSITIGSTVFENSFTPNAPVHLNSNWGSCTKSATYDYPVTSPNYNSCLTLLRAASPLSFAMQGHTLFMQSPQLWKNRLDVNKRFVSDTTQVYDTVPPGKVECPLTLSIQALQVNENASTVCNDPIGKEINPYYVGMLGNWRPEVSYVYTVKREQKPGNPIQVGGTDIRNSGYYTTYSPFWNFTTGGLTNTIPQGSLNPVDNRWVWSNRSVYYDQKGNEIESVDALNRYGSALFGYQQSLAVAVGANARRNEIAFDGFEDYDFNLSNGDTEKCPLKKHFDFGFVKTNGVWESPGGNSITNEKSHTGKYSYKLTADVDITKQAGDAAPLNPFWDYNNGKYRLLGNELAKGFAPIAGKKYLLSFWVNDNSPETNTVQNLEVAINGGGQDISNIIVPVVEGWKRLDLTFIATTNFNLQLTRSGTIFIDDFRILPNDGQLGSYVYNDVTLRLMAQLDENNFATFYEYDDEGTPIRVKKETERGIMTLKESRQLLRPRYD